VSLRPASEENRFSKLLPDLSLGIFLFVLFILCFIIMIVVRNSRIVIEDRTHFANYYHRIVSCYKIINRLFIFRRATNVYTYMYICVCTIIEIDGRRIHVTLLSRIFLQKIFYLLREIIHNGRFWVK
jgi:hypothetical protein